MIFKSSSRIFSCCCGGTSLVFALSIPSHPSIHPSVHLSVRPCAFRHKSILANVCVLELAAKIFKLEGFATRRRPRAAFFFRCASWLLDRRCLNEFGQRVRYGGEVRRGRESILIIKTTRMMRWWAVKLWAVFGWFICLRFMLVGFCFCKLVINVYGRVVAIYLNNNWYIYK